MASLSHAAEDSGCVKGKDVVVDQNALDSNDTFTFTEKVTVTK
jgi:hypothetical protein